MEIILIPVYPIRNRSYRSLEKQDCELMRPPVLASETQKIEGTKSQSLSVLKIIMTAEEKNSSQMWISIANLLFWFLVCIVHFEDKLKKVPLNTFIVRVDRIA